MVLDCQRTLRNGILHRSHHKDTTFSRLSPNISPPFFPSFFPPRQHPYCVRQQNKEVSRHNKETDEEDKEVLHQKRTKKSKISRKLPLFQDFARFFPSAKTKMPRKFWQKAKRRAFLKFSKKGILSNFREVLGVLGQVGLVGQIGDSVERSACRTGRTSRTSPISNKAARASRGS